MATKNKPLVSMVLPCYNAEKVIIKCVDNFLATNYKNFELLIIDDGSKDATYEIIKKKYLSNPKVRLFRNFKNLGVAPTKNVGIRNAKGKYISVMETDQEVRSDWLTPVVAELEKNPKLAGIQSKILDIDNKDKVEMCGLLFVPHTLWVVTRGISQPSNRFTKKEHVALGLGGSTVRKSVYKKIHLFDEFCPYSQGDSDLNWPIWMLGYKTLLVPQSIFYHETFKPLSKSKVSGFYREFNFNKTPRVFLKNYEVKNIIKYMPQLLFILFLRALSHLAKGNFYPIMGFCASLGWNIYVLPDTLKKRKYIQSLRRVGDDEIMQNICVKGSFWENYFTKLRPVISAFYKLTAKNKSVMGILSSSNFRNT